MAETSKTATDSNSKKLSPVELIKISSDHLRGTIADELQNDSTAFGKESIQVLKHHGTYQQDNRDERMANREKGIKDKNFSMMLRTALPGGKITSKQLLAELAIGDELGDQTIRLTTRQAIQHHGILKSDLKETIARINAAKMSTLAACGDVNRNVMCCPAPLKDNIHSALQDMADAVAAHLLPQTRAYYELWMTDNETEQKELVGGGAEEVEPIYGKTYLPRKFKTAIGLPYDNCADLYTNDLGLMAVIENDAIIGYNVLVGGGMGMTPAKKTTFPAVAQRMCFVPPDQVLKIAENVVKVQRDHGNRADRKHARMKYLIHNWGLPKFRSTVEEYFGSPLADPHVSDVHEFDDHMGWHEQGDGNWFYGLNVENGRIYNNDKVQLKAALIEIASGMAPDMRVTAHQSLIFCDIQPSQKSELQSILEKHNVPLSESFSTVRRWSMACVAWPTCGLAITESERALPSLLTEIEAELEKLELDKDRFTVRMTGCPNGCARPYNADIGLVGKAKDRYTVYLGGRLLGNRIGFIYKDLVFRHEICAELTKVFTLYKQEREENETFGDYCNRLGKDELLAKTDEAEN